MGLYLFAAFVAVPIIEIVLLIELGGLLGTPATILLVIATAAAGTHLLRQQGRQTLRRAQSEIQKGHIPAKELFDGLCLFAAGLLLLTPGLLTDAIGGALLIPAIRKRLQTKIIQNIKFKNQTFTTVHTSETQTNFFHDSNPDTIDGEYTIIKSDHKKPESHKQNNPNLSDNRTLH